MNSIGSDSHGAGDNLYFNKLNDQIHSKIQRCDKMYQYNKTPWVNLLKKKM